MFQLLAQDVHIKQQAGNKTAAIELIAKALVAAGYVEPNYVQGMLQRELQSATYLGNGIAIPHGTTDTRDQVKQTGVQVFHFPQGVSWGDEGELAYIVIGIAASSDEHLTLLRQLTHVLADEQVMQKITQIQTVDDVIAILTGQSTQTDIEPAIYCRLDIPVEQPEMLQALNVSILLKNSAINTDFATQALAQTPLYLGEGVWLNDSAVGNLQNAVVVGRPQTTLTLNNQPLAVLLTTAVAGEMDNLAERLAQATFQQQLGFLKQADEAAIRAFLTNQIAEQSTTETPNSANSVTAIFTVRNPHGLHTRPGSALIKLIKQFNSQITVANLDGANQPVKASSLMKIVALGAKQGQRLQFTAVGEDADQAISAIGEAMASGLGEEIV